MVGSKQRGFTLIELVVVIVILGILAAFAVPKFMGLENQARVASINAMAGTLRSSAAMARGVWMAQGATGNITVEGQGVAMVNGYPGRANLTRLIQDTSGFTYTAANGRWTPVGARTPANCWIQYNEAPVNGVYTLTYNTTGTTAAIQQYLRTNC
jgi:MSHA pilin protein MshA